MTTPRRSKFEPYKPPAEFGQRVLETLQTINRSPEELVRAAGYESKKTLDRLAKGEGSLEFALAIRDQLQAWGADVATLPSLGVERDVPMEPWEVEWLELGRGLHRLASDAKFREVVDAVAGLIESHKDTALGSGLFPRRRG